MRRGEGEKGYSFPIPPVSRLQTMMMLQLLLLLVNVFFISAFLSPGNLNPLPLAKVRKLSKFSLSSIGRGDEASDLLEKAQRFREQAETLENAKREAKILVEQQKQAVLREENQMKNEWKDRYSVVVPILKDMDNEVMERVDFSPRINRGKSRIISTTAPLPLGIVLGQNNESDIITVDELSTEGNGAMVGGIRQGDILRAVTACQTTMETPTWQLLAGGIGQPKTKRFMFSVDGRPLEEVLDAVGSNRMDVSGRDVVLVVERVVG